MVFYFYAELREVLRFREGTEVLENGNLAVFYVYAGPGKVLENGNLTVFYVYAGSGKVWRFQPPLSFLCLRELKTGPQEPRSAKYNLL